MNESPSICDLICTYCLTQFSFPFHFPAFCMFHKLFIPMITLRSVCIEPSFMKRSTSSLLTADGATNNGGQTMMYSDNGGTCFNCRSRAFFSKFRNNILGFKFS